MITGKLMWYKGNKTCDNMLLWENNQFCIMTSLFSYNSATRSYIWLADFFPFQVSCLVWSRWLRRAPSWSARTSSGSLSSASTTRSSEVAEMGGASPQSCMIIFTQTDLHSLGLGMHPGLISTGSGQQDWGSRVQFSNAVYAYFIYFSKMGCTALQ